MRFGSALWRGLLAGALLAASLLGPYAPAAGSSAPGAPSATGASGQALSAWRGGVDLYRAGVFTTQRTWLWCTAADTQIARNIVFRRTDHSYAGQQGYFVWMRGHNRYRLPLAAGVDAAGWTAGFQHFVDARYRLYASTSFDAALRAAVTNLRRTSLPVGITVDRGNHAWLLTGFTATADPARTTAFTITSVRVTGPLYGLQSKNGYDMPPDTRLTPAQLRRFFTPWSYGPLRMVWDGRYVSVQPVAAPTATATATPNPDARPTAAPTPTPASTAPPSSPPAASASPPPGPPAASSGPSPLAFGGTAAVPTTSIPSAVDDQSPIARAARLGLPVLALAIAAVGVGWLALMRRGRTRRP